MNRVDAVLPASPWRFAVRWLWSLEHAFERARAAGKAEDDTRIRIFFVLTLFAAAFMLLGVNAARATLGGGDGVGVAWRPPPGRADIVDRSGRMLAADLLHYSLRLEPSEVWDRAETARALKAALPDVDPDRIDAALAGDGPAFLKGGLTPPERARIHALAIPGVSFDPEQRRVYPLGVTAAHVLGLTDTGGRGLAGVELSLDDEIRAAAVEGRPVALSLDLRVQAALEDELFQAARDFQAARAVGIVTDVHTGEVLGLASWPAFEPGRPEAASAFARKNHAAASVYEMGSTFKVFTVALGLDSGAARLDTTYDATTPLKFGGQTINDYHAENRVMTVADIFLKSSNIGTSKLALDVGADQVVDYFDRFGLTKAAPIELSESTRPLLPRKWSDNIVASASFGHSISVSPLALAAGMGAVFNGGTYVPLSLRPVEDRPQGRRVISEGTSRTMLELMRANVVRGTGGKANAPGLRVGGKTGSAEKVIDGRYVRNKLVSSFAAVFPSDGPLEADRYFVLILLDEPKGNAETFGYATGGWTAAPPAGRVIDRIAPFLGVERREEVAKVAELTPELINGGEH